MIVLIYLENHELLYIYGVIVETLKKPKDPISLDAVSRSFKKIEIVFVPSSQPSLHKKWSFPLRISSVNVTKSEVSSGFGHIYWRNSYSKTSLFVQCIKSEESTNKHHDIINIIKPEDILQYMINSSSKYTSVHPMELNWLVTQKKFIVHWCIPLYH